MSLTGWIEKHDDILHFWSELALERRNTHPTQFALLFFKHWHVSSFFTSCLQGIFFFGPFDLIVLPSFQTMLYNSALL